MVDGKFTEGLISTTLFSSTTSMPIVSSLRVHGNQISRQRQILIDYWADKLETDWLLCVDSDITITPNILTTLCNSVENNEIEIVSGVYFISKQNAAA